MAIPALQAAKAMGEYSGWSLSNLEMQKLLYIAHMFHLGIHGSPLVYGNFEAWDLGPVHPVLYHKAKIFGARPVRNIFRSIPKLEEGTELGTLNNTVKELMNLDSAMLVNITHWHGGAWARNYVPGKRGTIIPDSHIEDEYKRRRKDFENQRSHASDASP